MTDGIFGDWDLYYSQETPRFPPSAKATAANVESPRMNKLPPATKNFGGNGHWMNYETVDLFYHVWWYSTALRSWRDMRLHKIVPRTKKRTRGRVTPNMVRASTSLMRRGWREDLRLCLRELCRRRLFAQIVDVCKP